MGFVKFNFIFLFSFLALFADCEMQHCLFFVVEPLNQIGQFIGPAPYFHISDKSQNSTVTNTYSIATNGVNKKMTGYLDKDMPNGTFLWVNMSPPSGARSMGTQLLSATPVDLLIELTHVAETELSMTYTFQAKPHAGVIPGTSRVVFYTMTDG